MKHTQTFAHVPMVSEARSTRLAWTPACQAAARTVDSGKRLPNPILDVRFVRYVRSGVVLVCDHVAEGRECGEMAHSHEMLIHQLEVCITGISMGKYTNWTVSDSPMSFPK